LRNLNAEFFAATSGAPGETVQHKPVHSHGRESAVKATRRILLAVALLALVAMFVARAVTLTWDPSPAAEQVTGYNLYQATNVAGPWTFIGKTSTTNFTADVTPGCWFWYVTASNFWTNSPPSNIRNTPPVPTKLNTPTVTR
jgi:hypothetical protein